MQSCCPAYAGRLQAVGARVSMAEVGSPYENAPAEGMNGILPPPTGGGQDYDGLEGLFGSEQQGQRAVEEAAWLLSERASTSVRGATARRARSMPPSAWPHEQILLRRRKTVSTCFRT